MCPQRHNKTKDMNEVIFEDIVFPSEQALHEWRLIFDFEYYSDCVEQNYPNI
jgi:hypothetical protein